MSAKYETGQLVSGTVTGIQRYGAFIALNEETQGLVHISEITNGFVRDIADFLKIGDTVLVKIISINADDGKIALSMRENEEVVRSRRSHRHSDNGERTYPVETGTGFEALRERMDDWIKQATDEHS